MKCSSPAGRHCAGEGPNPETGACCGKWNAYLSTTPDHEYADQEASKIIRGPRRMTYGEPRASFGAIAQAWNAYLDRRGDIGPLTGYDVTQFMILLKVIRGASGYHRDSTVDTVGYAVLAEVLSDDEAYADFIT